MHVVDGATRLSLTLTGAQAWTLAGLFVDATVAHAHAVVDQTDTATDQDTAAAAIARRTGPDRPLWLLDRHPNGRMPRQRAGRPARCIYRPGAGDKHRPARGDG
ncbi:MAG TPA: hypothetical protein VJY85_09775 [Candidatus Limnocylindria bacterium]|nr:hypothetical protein [Candidatus Limnocylindria bacterium]